MDSTDPPNEAGSEPTPPPADDVDLLAECRIDTFTAGGKGGQHQNRTQSGVRLVHGPSGEVVSSRRYRSQRRNQQAALEELRRRLEAAARPAQPRVATRVPRREKEKRRKEKDHRSKVKRQRRPPGAED